MEASLEEKMQHDHRLADVKGPLGMRTTPLQPPPPHPGRSNFFHFYAVFDKNLEKWKCFCLKIPHLGKLGSATENVSSYWNPFHSYCINNFTWSIFKTGTRKSTFWVDPEQLSTSTSFQLEGEFFYTSVVGGVHTQNMRVGKPSQKVHLPLDGKPIVLTSSGGHWSSQYTYFWCGHLRLKVRRCPKVWTPLNLKSEV